MASRLALYPFCRPLLVASQILLFAQHISHRSFITFSWPGSLRKSIRPLLYSHSPFPLALPLSPFFPSLSHAHVHATGDGPTLRPFFRRVLRDASKNTAVVGQPRYGREYIKEEEGVGGEGRGITRPRHPQVNLRYKHIYFRVTSNGPSAHYSIRQILIPLRLLRQYTRAMLRTLICGYPS